MSRILLHLRGIGLTFGGRPILESAELAVAEGERVAPQRLADLARRLDAHDTCRRTPCYESS